MCFSRRTMGFNKQSGLALVMVLYLAVVITVFVASGTVITKYSIGNAQMMRDKVRAELIAESTKAELLFQLFTDPALLSGVRSNSSRIGMGRTESAWLDKLNFEGIPIVVAEGVKLTIRDNSGRIALHVQNQNTLYRTLLAMGKDHDAASLIVDSIGDWTDSDSFVRVNGAERDSYDNGRPRNNNFEHVSELKLVNGMDQATYERLIPMVRLYGSEQVAAYYAQQDILTALTSKSIASKVAEQRDKGRISSLEFSGLTGLTPGEGGRYKPSRSFTIQISASVNDAVHNLEFIVFRPRSNDVPFYLSSIRKS